MVGFMRSRMMRLLKRTSVHNRPGNLAAAVALGLFAGALPKANLLFALAALLVLLLPLHNLLAIAVCLVASLSMMRISTHSDLLTDRIGLWLLELAPLRSMWMALDALPIVPWLCLHNSVVLGSLALGIVCLAPTYLVALRWFESCQHAFANAEKKRLQPITSREPKLDSTDKPLVVTVGTSQTQVHETIPRPHLDKRTAATSTSPVAVPQDDEGYDPVHDVTAIINAWHMGRSQTVTAEQDATHNQYPLRMHYATAGNAISNYATAVSASVSNESVSHDSGSHDSGSPATNPETTLGTQPRSIETLRKQLNSLTLRDQSIDSLELAQGATEVLAWVDELLDECLIDQCLPSECLPSECLPSESLSKDKPSTTSNKVHGLSAGSIQNPQHPATGSERSGAQSVHAPRSNDYVATRQAEYVTRDLYQSLSGDQWVIETTVEIVRLADETIAEVTSPSSSDNVPTTQNQSQNNQPTAGRPEGSGVTRKQTLESTQTMFATQTPQEWQAAAAGLSQIEALLAVEQAPERRSDNRTARLAESRSTSQPRVADSIEPVRGESLAYLLGHLRQVREGKSV